MPQDNPFIINDRIHLLPDAVANQIAAGEVVVGPYSVVKELMENAIDAGASHVTIVIKGAGRTSIQVIDDGCGMSPSDALMSLQRHATSKISKAEDLFTLSTMGFRGEALPSIVSVSCVEIKTRTAQQEMGTLLEVDGSKISKNEEIATPVGTSITVKNLFYNVPARRKFLKSDETETRKIITEFQRVALATPNVAFSLYNGATLIYDLPTSNLKQRIVNIFGKKIKHYEDVLVPLGIKNGIVNITGFTGTPESSIKNANQMFFVNGRFMRHPYFHKAVMQAYEKMLPPDTAPHYFIYFDVNPHDIDINVHPTKTEIKFENEREIWQILMACIREALGKFNIAPTLIFDNQQLIDIPVANGNKTPTMPTPHFDKNYNPFNSSTRNSNNYQRTSTPQQWQMLYESKKKEELKPYDINPTIHNQEPHTNQQPALFEKRQTESYGNLFLFKNRYLITALETEMMIIDCRRALERILYDELLLQLQQQQCISQQILFPEVWELTPEMMPIYESIKDDLKALGFQLSPIAACAFSINGIPATLTSVPQIPQVLNKLLQIAKEEQKNLKKELYEPIVIELASTQSTHVKIGESQEELRQIIKQLFATTMPNISPKGHKIITTISEREINGWFD
ncbi:MAG: DNA mismatch repair endonuclease MutL [Bacteroidales bacterium]|nr:DNA mismatch repair endonuclease MutL [Bacteroidales bacterium]